MKQILTIVGSILSAGMLAGTVSGPDGRLSVAVETDADGVPRWQVSSDGRAVTEYVVDAPIGVKGHYGKGWTFPCLFRNGETWLLVSETGTDSNYCGWNRHNPLVL